MNQASIQLKSQPEFRPWFREPWVWVLIAFPSAAIVGCAITIWLALSHPDYLVVDELQHQQIESGPGSVSVVPEETGKSSVTQENDDG